MLFKTLFALSSSVAAVWAALPSGTVTCGDDRYSVSAIEAAINAGVEDMNSDYYPGPYSAIYSDLFRLTSDIKDDYPHQYYEYAVNSIDRRQGRNSTNVCGRSEESEHITLYCSGDGPWYEVCIRPFSRKIEIRILLTVPDHAEW